MKKLLTFIFCLTLSFLTVGANISANETIDDTQYYEEKGQINLNQLNLKSLNKELNINVKSNSLEANAQKYQLLNELRNSPELEEYLLNTIEEGNENIAIGYTRVYLKEVVEENDKIHVEPMTIAEVNNYENSKKLRNNGSVTTSPSGTCTLYTQAYIETYSKDTYANSIVNYNKTNGLPYQIPNNGFYHAISILLPSTHTLKSSAILSSTYNDYKELETKNGVAWKVVLGGGSAPPKTSVILGSNGFSSSGISNKKIISDYVHSYKSAKITLGFSKIGLTLSISSTDAAWKISSSVIVAC